MTLLSNLRLVALASSIAVSGVVSAPALADTRQETVATHDLDLNDRDDSVRLANRIDEASQRVCARAWDNIRQQLRSKQFNREDFETCRIDAIESAAAEVDEPIALAVLAERFPAADIAQTVPTRTRADGAITSERRS